MLNKPRVVVTRKWPEAVERRLQELFDVKLNINDEPLSIEQMRDAMRHADALCTTVSDKIDREVLSVRPLRCKILGNFGVGFNHIDLDAAKEAGLVVTNTPDVLTDCTADLTMMLILMVARRAGEGERQLRNGQWSSWKPMHLLGTRVSGKTLGLIGMGRIARAVAHRAIHGFGMRVIYYNRSDISKDLPPDIQVRACQSIEAVLKEADFVSLHCPGGETTRHLINTDSLAMMKAGAYLINTARGDVIDESALISALQNRSIAGAGLDVYANEPKVPAPLLTMDNVTLLPHLGSASMETRVAMGLRVLENLCAYFAGETPPDRVL